MVLQMQLRTKCTTLLIVNVIGYVLRWTSQAKYFLDFYVKQQRKVLGFDPQNSIFSKEFYL